MRFGLIWDGSGGNCGGRCRLGAEYGDESQANQE